MPEGMKLTCMGRQDHKPGVSNPTLCSLGSVLNEFKSSLLQNLPCSPHLSSLLPPKYTYIYIHMYIYACLHQRDLAQFLQFLRDIHHVRLMSPTAGVSWVGQIRSPSRTRSTALPCFLGIYAPGSFHLFGVR